MTQNIPYLEYMTTDCGTRKNPFLIHVTSGERDNSHVFHCKEDNKYFQYHIKNVNKASVNLTCMYKKSRKCPATVTLVPSNQNMIKTIRTEKVASNGALKYALNEEVPLTLVSTEPQLWLQHT